jgi:hypothetical protein
MDALVAQRQSRRLLTGWSQVRVLPGALEEEGSGVDMRRLISLFKELDDGYPAANEPERPPSSYEPKIGQEPLYFVELLKHLREQKAKDEAERARAKNAHQN